MKTIEIDEELYQFIAGQTQHIGEDASSILRRLLKFNQLSAIDIAPSELTENNYSVIENLIKSERFTKERSTISRFLTVLNALYNYNSALFSIAATSLHGRKRQYLAKDKKALETSGKNTKPREIIGTPYWVISNTNTARKILIIESIMSDMGISESMINQVTHAFSPSSK